MITLSRYIEFKIASINYYFFFSVLPTDEKCCSGSIANFNLLFDLRSPFKGKWYCNFSLLMTGLIVATRRFIPAIILNYRITKKKSIILSRDRLKAPDDQPGKRGQKRK
jgi:hypothetical protein